MIKRYPSIHQSLPQEFNGRWQTLLFLLSLSLLLLFVGAGIIWDGLDQTGYELPLKIVIGLWPFLVGLIFLYMSFSFTWRLTLLPDSIVIQHPFHKSQFALDSLLSVQLLAINSSRTAAKNPVVLQFNFANGRSPRITQQEISLPLPQLFEVVRTHYQLPLSFEKVSTTVPHTRFGAGSRRPFSHYFEGESGVSVRSVADICHWLKQCSYVRDVELFNQRDVWQHPGQFEALKKGDCEDHALWAWRKLKELNIAAEFVVGRTNWSEDEGGMQNGAHAWVVYEENGRSYLLEATHKRQLIYPQEVVQKQYQPWFSIDQSLQTYKFLPTAKQERSREK